MQFHFVLYKYQDYYSRNMWTHVYSKRTFTNLILYPMMCIKHIESTVWIYYVYCSRLTHTASSKKLCTRVMSVAAVTDNLGAILLIEMWNRFLKILLHLSDDSLVYISKLFLLVQNMIFWFQRTRVYLPIVTKCNSTKSRIVYRV